MIFLCPKALSSKDNRALEREFLKFYLSVSDKKAFLTNELWETFRYRTITKATNKGGAYKLIAEYRGMFTPENIRIDENFQEVEPKKEYNKKELEKETINFLERNWADIELFITQNPELYKKVIDKYNIKTQTLEQFYLDCMVDNRRKALVDYWNKINQERAE